MPPRLLAPRKQTHMAIEIDDNATDILALTCGIKAMAGRVCQDDPAAAFPDILMDIARMLAGADVRDGFTYLGTAAAYVAAIAVTNGAWSVDEVMGTFRKLLTERLANPDPV